MGFEVEVCVAAVLELGSALFCGPLRCLKVACELEPLQLKAAASNSPHSN